MRNQFNRDDFEKSTSATNAGFGLNNNLKIIIITAAAVLLVCIIGFAIWNAASNNPNDKSDDYGYGDEYYDEGSSYDNESTDYDYSEYLDVDFIIPNSDSTLLSRSDVASLSDYELLIARNEIYARHGRIFIDSDVKTYFDSKDWYEGTIAPEEFDANAGEIFNSIEKKNIDIIVNEEQSRE